MGVPIKRDKPFWGSPYFDMHVYIYIYVYRCICMYIYIYMIYRYIYIYIYIYVKIHIMHITFRFWRTQFRSDASSGERHLQALLHPFVKDDAVASAIHPATMARGTCGRAWGKISFPASEFWRLCTFLERQLWKSADFFPVRRPASKGVLKDNVAGKQSLFYFGQATEASLFEANCSRQAQFVETMR